MSKNINQPPKYCKDAIASNLGWEDPKTGELLISNKSLDLDGIKEKYPNQVKVDIPEKVKPTIEPTSIEDDVEELVSTEVETQVKDEMDESIDYESMTKAKLIQYAKDTFDVDLSKKDNKSTLITKINELNE